MDNEKWLKHYRTNKSAIWINVKLTSGEEFYNDDFAQWLEIKQKCDAEKLFVKELSLQFRSHKVDIDLTDAEGLYLIRSIMGQVGVDSKQYFTTGVLKDGVVHKQMWLVPELLIEKEFSDHVEDCFEEALIYDKTKKNR